MRRHLHLGFGLWLGLSLAGCGPGGGAGQKSPSPVAAPRQAAIAPPSPGVSIAWSFEAGMDGFIATAGAAAPSCDEVQAARLRGPTGGPLVTLNPPGSYWQTPVDIGQVGRCRIDTELPAHHAVRLVSPRFTIAARYLTFRLGGGGRPGARVELHLEDGGVARTERGPGTLAMGGVVWDLAELRGKVATVEILDDGAAGTGLLVDDFRDHEERPLAAPAPVWGFADLHAHPLSRLGFGQHLFTGAEDGPLEQALGACTLEHGHDGGGGRAGYVVGVLEESPNRVLGHRTSGYPDFKGWPLHSTQIHQQMHVDWLRRAHAGGLRLVVALAVNNEQLAHATHPEPDSDDVHVVTAELEATRALVGRHDDFMRIALTPDDARTIIASGRLAVVLGVEVDSLGNCRDDADCTEVEVRTELRRLYALGARHVFPVHLADNPLGGASVYKAQTFNLLSWFLRDKYQHVEHEGSVEFAYEPFHASPPALFATLSGMKNLEGKAPFLPPYASYTAVPRGHINNRGLTPLGVSALAEMMKLGMLIDIDHMGQKSRADALRLAAEQKPPVPLVMGHTRFRDLGYTRDQTSDADKITNEAMKTAAEIAAVRALGGIVAPITRQGDVRRAASSGILSECAGSSSSWLQAYSYLTSALGDAGVGFGTDFNGLAGEPGPRFGPNACLERRKGDGDDTLRHAPNLDMRRTLRADVEAQASGVTYATPPSYAAAPRFLGAGKLAPYTDDGRDAWIAFAAVAAGASLDVLGLEGAERRNVRDLMAGLADTTLPSGPDARRAAFLVKSAAPAQGSGNLKHWYEEIAAVKRQWERMQAGNADAPLERSVAGSRDFDINLDGLAHYGLLPDFLQDLANQLRARATVEPNATPDLRLVFRSAESYLRTWERATAAAATGTP